ncbi:DUF3293 domain-containing protein [Pseudoalteromonas rubra]|uniref:DUF3293 domain-containing protein n=1 Tax=Pseudoalteromonas rubra TaxID=43658 RepID=A0A0U2ZDP2_9GAMM|nr:DUF3293 domain-containing protein [Pseudoalteromonas rubra]ALU45937.1 hypothetical protein AT705_23725 [Pseudoalteromonas rubra]
MHRQIENELWQLYQDVWFRPCSALPAAPKGAIISLWNPLGIKRTLAENRRFQHLLYPALKRIGYKMHPLWGANASLDYREFSVLIVCSERAAARLAALCYQKAYYFVQQDQVCLHNTHHSQQRVQLSASFQTRITYDALPAHNAAIQDLSQ